MKCTVGIDLGGTVIKIGIVRDGKLLETVRIPANSSSGLAPSLPVITEAIEGLLSRHGIAGPDAVCLAFPGIVDVREGRAAGTNAKYSDAPSIDLESWAVGNWPGTRFFIDNDARMATVGEWKAGAGQGYDDIVMMTIGTGIGTGAVIDGRLIYGKNWCAGALGGHMIVDYRGRRCSCGNVGCVEAMASSFFLPEIISGDGGLDEGFRNDPENRNFRTLFGKYAAGDRNAKAVVEYCMDVWSAAVVNYVHAYDPEIVILGGGIMKSEDIIIPYVSEKVNSLVFRAGNAGKVDIVPAGLGDDAAIIGADFYLNKE